MFFYRLTSLEPSGNALSCLFCQNVSARAPISSVGLMVRQERQYCEPRLIASQVMCRSLWRYGARYHCQVSTYTTKIGTNKEPRQIKDLFFSYLRSLEHTSITVHSFTRSVGACSTLVNSIVLLIQVFPLLDIIHSFHLL